MTHKKPSKPQVFQGETIYAAFNAISRKMEVVTPDSEVSVDQMIVPMFWNKEAQRYMTVPGTEVYGYVPGK